MNSGTIDIAGQVKGFFGFQCISHFVFRLVDVALIGGGLLLLALLVWGGIEWITSGGDKGKVESARNRITNALIGLTIVAAAYAFWLIVLYFLGIDVSNICTTSPFK